MAAELELFATSYCWQCSACKQKYDALWRPAERPQKPLEAYMWNLDKPVFKYCPMCGEKFETEINVENS